MTDQNETAAPAQPGDGGKQDHADRSEQYHGPEDRANPPRPIDITERLNLAFLPLLAEYDIGRIGKVEKVVPELIQAGLAPVDLINAVRNVGFDNITRGEAWCWSHYTAAKAKIAEDAEDRTVACLATKAFHSMALVWPPKTKKDALVKLTAALEELESMGDLNSADEHIRDAVNYLRGLDWQGNPVETAGGDDAQ